MDSIIEDRLSVFDDEPDLNDWVEVMCGAAMAVIGIFHLVQPGELVDPDIMRWFAAAVVAAGAVWAGHGLKDMAVKEVRRSIAILELSEISSSEGPNHGHTNCAGSSHHPTDPPPNQNNPQKSGHPLVQLRHPPRPIQGLHIRPPTKAREAKGLTLSPFLQGDGEKTNCLHESAHPGGPHGQWTTVPRRTGGS